MIDSIHLARIAVLSMLKLGRTKAWIARTSGVDKSIISRLSPKDGDKKDEELDVSISAPVAEALVDTLAKNISVQLSAFCSIFETDLTVTMPSLLECFSSSFRPAEHCMHEKDQSSELYAKAWRFMGAVNALRAINGLPPLPFKGKTEGLTFESPDGDVILIMTPRLVDGASLSEDQVSCVTRHELDHVLERASFQLADAKSRIKAIKKTLDTPSRKRRIKPPNYFA